MALADWRNNPDSKEAHTSNFKPQCTADPPLHNVDFEHLAHFCHSLMEIQKDQRLADASRLSLGCARVLIENSKPCRFVAAKRGFPFQTICASSNYFQSMERNILIADMHVVLSFGCFCGIRCSGITSFGNCHLWHNYRPLKEPIEELIQRLVYSYEDSTSIIVTLAPAILRFCKNEGVILCKDQFLRLISVRRNPSSRPVCIASMSTLVPLRPLVNLKCLNSLRFRDLRLL